MVTLKILKIENGVVTFEYYPENDREHKGVVVIDLVNEKLISHFKANYIMAMSYYYSALKKIKLDAPINKVMTVAWG